MREVIDIDAEMKASEKVLFDLHQKVTIGEEIVRVSNALPLRCAEHDLQDQPRLGSSKRTKRTSRP
jgi:hypothetical protein